MILMACGIRIKLRGKSPGGTPPEPPAGDEVFYYDNSIKGASVKYYNNGVQGDPVKYYQV